MYIYKNRCNRNQKPPWRAVLPLLGNRQKRLFEICYNEHNRITMWLEILVGIILTIVGLLIYGYFRLKYIQSKQKADFSKIFGDWKSSLPTLDFGSSYGWRTFKVTFQNKNDLDFATKNMLTEDFKNCIKKYYNSKFDVDLAVYFTHSEAE